MEAMRFSETQIVAILKQGHTGIKVNDIFREYGMSDVTYYNENSKYDSLEISNLKLLKAI